MYQAIRRLLKRKSHSIESVSDLDSFPHGTISRFVTGGCRCEACEDATRVPDEVTEYDGYINPKSGYVPNGKSVPARPPASAAHFGLSRLPNRH